MCSKTIYSIITDLDNQISQIPLHKHNGYTLKVLLQIRNNMIRKLPLCKDRQDEDWHITDKKALAVLEYFNWNLIWETNK